MIPMSYQGELKNAAKVVAQNIGISRKVGREIAVFIKGKLVNRAIKDMEAVVAGKLAIPYKRFFKSIPHRAGMAAGRYPKRAGAEIIKLLKSLCSNAEAIGLDISKLVIVHAACQHGPKAWHYGRKRGRVRKLNHFELVGIEKADGKQKAKAAAPEIKDTPKVEKKAKTAKPKSEEKHVSVDAVNPVNKPTPKIQVDNVKAVKELTEKKVSE